jgi:hypothetical protein
MENLMSYSTKINIKDSVPKSKIGVIFGLIEL